MDIKKLIEGQKAPEPPRNKLHGSLRILKNEIMFRSMKNEITKFFDCEIDKTFAQLNKAVHDKYTLLRLKLYYEYEINSSPFKNDKEERDYLGLRKEYNKISQDEYEEMLKRYDTSRGTMEDARFTLPILMKWIKFNNLIIESLSDTYVEQNINHTLVPIDIEIKMLIINIALYEKSIEELKKDIKLETSKKNIDKYGIKLNRSEQIVSDFIKQKEDLESKREKLARDLRKKYQEIIGKAFEIKK